MALQQVHLQLEQPMLYCPVTGTLVADGENDTSPSPALLFSYLHEIGEFDYIRPDIEEKFQQIRAELEASGEEDEDPYETFLSSAFEDSCSILLLSMTYRGFACGPVWSRFDYCFDMDYAKEEDDDDVEDDTIDMESA